MLYNFKVGIVSIFVGFVIFMLVILLSVFNNFIGEQAIKKQIKNDIESPHEEKIKKDAVITINVIKDKQESLKKDASMIGNNETVVSTVGYGYSKTLDFNLFGSNSPTACGVIF